MCRNYSPSKMLEPYISIAARIERLGIAKPVPCGGCGAESEAERCIGCMHDFGTAQADTKVEVPNA